MSDVKPQNDRQTGILNAIERIGNAMPDITMLFIYALGCAGHSPLDYRLSTLIISTL